jgi:PAS domain S-box-containing protein
MENDLNRVVDLLPGLVWTALPDGQVDFLNQRWCEYTGLSVAEACGERWQTAIHPDDLPELLNRWRSILVSNASGEMEARLRRSDGEYRWFLFRTRPLADASGQVAKWCGLNIDIEELRQAEEALDAREHHFKLIFDGLPALIILMNPEGDLVRANRHCLEFFRATLEELQGRGQVHSYHPDDRPRVLAAWKKSLETGQPYVSEGRRRRADGVYRWFHTRGLPLRDTEGRIVLWYSLATDVDDQKRAEALLAGEKRVLEMAAGSHSMSEILGALCQVVENTTSGSYCSVALVDANGTRLEHGAAPSLPASFVSSIVGPSVNVDSDPSSMAVHLNEQVLAPDLRSETRWASREWYPMALTHGLQACWATPISSAAGKVLGAFAIYYNEPRTPTSLDQSLIGQITHIASVAIERTQRDAMLRRSEALLTQAQHLSSTCSFSWRVATEEITWSEEAIRIFELDEAAPVTNELFRSRVHPEDFPLLREMMERARGGNSIDFEYEHRLLMPDHSVKYVNMVCEGIRDQDGQLEYIAAVQDVTQRRRSEEALAKARSELARVARVTSMGALTASIAHELNQPLSGIITNASTCLRMLAADPPNVDGATETARRTIRDGNRASDVITRLRALFSKKEATTEPVDLNEATREVITLLRSELQRSRVILQAELSDDLPSVIADRVQLQQVILNLLRNASDAMNDVDDRPRELVIRTARDEDDRVRLTVRDTGVGFDPQAVDRLFDAFYTTKNDGMGIGLSVSRSIIESHHGRLWAEPNDGPGATFSFSIPQRSESLKGPLNLGAIRTPAAADVQRVMRNQ